MIFAAGVVGGRFGVGRFGCFVLCSGGHFDLIWGGVSLVLDHPRARKGVD